MEYQLLLRPRAIKELRKLPKAGHVRVTNVLIALSRNPYMGKKLAGEFKDYHSLRVWPYRIVYWIYKKELLVIVLRISHRQGIY